MYSNVGYREGPQWFTNDTLLTNRRFSARGVNVESSKHQLRGIINALKHATKSLPIEQQLVKFSEIPKTLDETPNPDIIHGTLLFFAERFKDRLNSEKHISRNSQSSELDQTIRKIFFLLENQSNDPIARALTLRCLGCMSVLLIERLDIQHGILQRLDSSVEIEASAAIFAADKLCSKTEKFSALAYEKFVTLLQANNVSLAFKTKLIRVFRHMHRDINLARKTRIICLQLLEQYPDEEFILTILKTLTFLSNRALVDRTDQINLLFKYVQDDPRERVKTSSLAYLIKIAQKDLTFETSHVLILLNIATSAGELNVKTKALRVLTILFQQTRLLGEIVSIDTEQETRIEALHFIQQCEDMIQDKIIEVNVVAVKLMSVIIIESKRIESISNILIGSEWETYFSDLCKKIAKLILSNLIQLVSFNQNERDKYVKMIQEYLKCLFSICQADNDLIKDISKMVINVLQDYIESNDDEIFAQLSKFFMKIAEYKGSLIQELRDDIFSLMKCHELIDMTRSFTMLAKTVLKVRPDNVKQAREFKESFMERINRFGNLQDGRYIQNQWDIYLIGLEAGKSGCCSIMGAIVFNFVNEVDVEAHRFWLRALSNASNAEQMILDNIDKIQSQLDLFDEGVKYYSKCDTELSGLMSLIDNNGIRVFGKWFCQLRARFFSTMKLILAQLNFLSSKTPGLFDPEIVKINESLVFLACMHNFVAHSFLDIDSESLEILESYQICCLVLSYAIQCLLFQREESIDPLLIPLIRLARCNMNDTLSRQVNDMNLRKNKVQYVLRSRCVEILKDIEMIRLERLSKFVLFILSVPINLPPFFFENKKGTYIKWSKVPALGWSQRGSRVSSTTISDREKVVIKLEGILKLAKKSAKKHLNNIQFIIFGSKADMFEFEEFEETLQGNFSFSNLALDYKGGDSDSIGFLNVHTRIVDNKNIVWTIGPDLIISPPPEYQNNNQY
ncbi:6690_t:CDS:10 [Funneliformis caledonium]|uniref:6690_t:CDS:1 n=1 Tax=Funneliformis caledonium TaxID=1117310 RepID=A0A9N9AV18_9GLOM|nr:6690_t:CDS:10 [Funneliformis caledonium]